MTRGRVETVWFDSTVLRGNPLGDPHERRIPVWLPPSYDTHPERRYPVLYALTGFGSRGRALLNDNPWSPSLDDRLDALAAAGAPECIVVMPDAYNSFQGSFYSSSATIGDWETYVARELVTAIDAKYRTLARVSSRGLAGHSMGGYGAMRLGMKYPDVFGAVYLMSACCMTPPAGGAGVASATAAGRSERRDPAAAETGGAAGGGGIYYNVKTYGAVGNGVTDDTVAIKAAITAAKGAGKAMELLVKRDDKYMTITLDYHDGLRWPWLEKTGEGPDWFDRLFAAKRAL